MVVSMFQEKRNTVRVRSIHLLSFATLADPQCGQELGMGRTLNVSEDGLLVEAFKSVAPGTELEILMSIGDDCLTTRGKVIRSHKEKSKWTVAIQFTHISPQEQQILHGYLDKNFPYTRLTQ